MTFPAQVLDLRSWKLTLPTGSSGHPTEIKQPALATYSSPAWFRAIGDIGVSFAAPVNGVTTSGSSNPRSELREMTTDGSPASWSSTDGKTHTMIIDQVVRQLPNPRTDGGNAAVVCGQIHDASNDISVFRVEDGKVWVTNGNNTHYALADDNYRLGALFQVAFVVSGGTVHAFYNGRQVATISVKGSGWYFKAGAYVQANTSNSKPADSSNFGETVVYGLTVAHGAPIPIPAPGQQPVDPPPTPVPTPVVPIVMLIRHGEGGTNAHTLNSVGQKRALAIADLFSADPIRQGLYRPDRLVVSEGKTASLRPYQTLAPLSAKLAEPEITAFAAADYKKLAKQLPKYGGVTLVAWAHTELPKILKAMKVKAPTTWPDSRYDVIWLLTGDGKGGWAFTQQPEMLLPGDISRGI